MLKPGESFDRYTIEAVVGEGGMGRVYRAHDARLGRRVAVKVISEAARGDEASARLIREARAAAALDHPNAVAIFDVGELDGAPFIVMELVEGRTLRGAIGDAAVPVPTRIAWLADVARALAAAHRRGLVHRDVKPENVMVREDGVVKVLDFGIARRVGVGIIADGYASTQDPAMATLTVEGVRLGTPVYMAPEQVRGEPLDGRADQFGWGVLAYEILAGRLPWRGASDAFAVVASILTDEVDQAALDRASVPPGVQDILLRALAKRREDRFDSMDDVVRALDAAARGEAPPAPRELPPERAPAPRGLPPERAPAPRGLPPERAPDAPRPPERAPDAPRPDPFPGSVTAAQRYSTGDVRDVLARAIEQQAAMRADAGLGFDDLLEAAREVGVDAETLRDASRALRARDQPLPPAPREAAEREAWIRRNRRLFYRHLGIYFIVNTAILVLGRFPMVAPFFSYVLLIPLLWGIGAAIHGLTALTANEDDWAEEKKGMEWWLERERRRHEVVLARVSRGRGPTSPADAAPPRRPREALPDPAQAKLRIGEDAAVDRTAEEEEAEAAALADDREAKRAEDRKLKRARR